MTDIRLLYYNEGVYLDQGRASDLGGSVPIEGQQLIIGSTFFKVVGVDGTDAPYTICVRLIRAEN